MSKKKYNNVVYNKYFFINKKLYYFMNNKYTIIFNILSKVFENIA